MFTVVLYHKCTAVISVRQHYLRSYMIYVFIAPGVSLGEGGIGVEIFCFQIVSAVVR